MCPDMGNSYDDWLKLATEQIRELKLNGIFLNKVEANADEFAAWCKLNARSPDAAARKIYAPVKFEETSNVSKN